MERKLVTVAVDGSAEFTTLTAAAAAQAKKPQLTPAPAPAPKKKGFFARLFGR